MAMILVIDDEIEACNALEDYLTNKGYEVITAYDGKNAIEKVKEFRPDIVLLDIIMPGMSGERILEQIKKMAPHIKVIMTTVVDNEEQVVKCFELGAHDFISKPMGFDHLEKVLISSLIDN